MSPTARSLEHLRDAGYLVDTVERYNSFSRQRKDMFGMFDLVALQRDEIQFIQVTSDSNVSARVKKLTNHGNLPMVRESGARILVHGWKKVKNRWQVRVVDLS